MCANEFGQMVNCRSFQVAYEKFIKTKTNIIVSIHDVSSMVIVLDVYTTTCLFNPYSCIAHHGLHSQQNNNLYLYIFNL